MLFTSVYRDIKEKIKILLEWHQCGKKNKLAGCMLIGYEAYRTLVTYHNSKKSLQTFPQDELDRVEKSVKEYLLNPGKISLHLGPSISHFTNRNSIFKLKLRC